VLGRLVAVKVIVPSMADDEDWRARFLRESRLAASIDSPHIVPVYAAGESDGLLYIATRYVGGGDLSGLVRREGGRLAPGRAVALIAQVASALDAAHAAGLVHRDVKPQNVLVDAVPERPEHAYLSDFGLSKGTSSSTGLTVSGQFLGTPDYCAPEQIRSGYVDGRADQYALGCVAFVLLTGALPFHRPETVATMFAHLQDPVPLVSRFRPDLPVAVNGVIARAMSKSPGNRYKRCADFAQDLRDSLASVPPGRPADPFSWLARDGAAGPAGRPGFGGRPGFTERARTDGLAGGPGWIPASQRAWRQPSYPGNDGSGRSYPGNDGSGRSYPGNDGGGRYESGPRYDGARYENADRYEPPGPSWGAASTALGQQRQPSSPTDPPAGLGGRTGFASTGSIGGIDTHVSSKRGRVARGGRRTGSRSFQTVVIGGAAALVIVAAGAIYALSAPGGSQPVGLAGLAGVSGPRPAAPTLAATLTVPGSATVDTTWVSQDGTLVAASGQGSAVYVWNTADPARVSTFTAPSITVAGTIYSAVIDNVAFSKDDSSITVLTYPNVPSGAQTPNYESSYAVYQWNLASGKRSLVWSLTTPSTIAISNDNSTALTYANNIVSLVTLSPTLNTTPSLTLPGGADQSYHPPYELDRTGNRMIYHPKGNLTYVWDFGTDGVIDKLKSSAYTVLSPDGKTMLAAHPTDYPAAGHGTPTLSDVATGANVTPADPRWKEQEAVTWETYSWDTYSTDGSVIATKRAGGDIDLWNASTRKYLLTITDPNYRKDDGYDLVGPGGSEVLIPTAEKTVNDEREYRQISLWETPLR
jgi:serine/threonine-protein kinase